MCPCASSCEEGSSAYQFPLQEVHHPADSRHVKPVEDILGLAAGLAQAGRGHKARRTGQGHVDQHITQAPAGDRRLGTSGQWPV